MNKAQKNQIEEIKTNAEKMIKLVEGVNTKILNAGGCIYVGIGVLPSCDILFDCNSYDNFIIKLSEIKKISKLKFYMYWIPYDRMTCISYIDDRKTHIRFSIEGNQDEIVPKISNGKCNVIETTKKEIQCKV